MAHSWVVKGLMLFLIVSFSVWGIGDIFRGNPLQKTVAKVGDEEISVQHLNRLFDEALAKARSGLTPNLTAQQGRQMGLMDKALDNEIKRDLIDLEVARQGIDITPAIVLQTVADQPQFRTKDGQFNKDLFQRLLKQQGMTESGFLAQGQQEMARQVLLDMLNGTDAVPQTMIDALYKARAQQRVLDVVTIDSAKINGVAAPSDKNLHDFYDQNPKLFTAPEYRGVTIATLSTDALTQSLVISDDQVKKDYEAKGDSLKHPEQRDIVQAVLQTEDQARQVMKQARDSGNLAAAARAQKATAVPLDAMEEKDLMPELAQAVFALREGAISEPVRTQLGWHVVQLKKIIPAGIPAFETVKNKMRADMQRDQGIEAATRAVNQLDDLLAAGRSLDDIADELKLRIVKIPALDEAGSMPDGAPAAELPNKKAVLKDAFAQNAGETSPVEDDKAGTYSVVRTDAITPSGVKPFDDVRGTVVAAWKAHRQMELAQAKAEKISLALREGKPTAMFKDDDAVSVRISAPLSQLGDTDAALPPELVTQAFKIAKGDTATGVSGTKQIVVRLTGVTDVDASKTDTRKNKIEGEIKKDIPDELLDQYVQHLRDVFPVKIDSALVDRLREQGG
jgi:peptidyl-prolyl cis-trans isomerase D